MRIALACALVLLVSALSWAQPIPRIPGCTPMQGNLIRETRLRLYVWPTNVSVGSSVDVSVVLEIGRAPLLLWMPRPLFDLSVRDPLGRELGRMLPPAPWPSSVVARPPRPFYLCPGSRVADRFDWDLTYWRGREQRQLGPGAYELVAVLAYPGDVVTSWESPVFPVRPLESVPVVLRVW